MTAPCLPRDRASVMAVLRHGALIVTGGLVLLPFIWMVSLSLKAPGDAFHGSFSLLPNHWYAVENYTAALTSAPLLHYLANGFFICATILGVQVFTLTSFAYALAKLSFPGRDFLFALVLIAMFIPHQVLALPLFVICSKLGILDSYTALILPYVISPFGIFLFRQFFKTIPDDLIYAARLDGLSEISIAWRVALPMATPALIAFSIFSVVSHWNDLFWPLIAVSSQDLMPPPLGVLALKNLEAGDDYGPLMAASVIVVLPLVLAFIAAQQWFVEGLTGGGGPVRRQAVGAVIWRPRMFGLRPEQRTRLAPYLGLAAAAAVLLFTAWELLPPTQPKATLSILYAYPSTFAGAQSQIARRFMLDHRQVKLGFRNPASSYEDETQLILRSAMVNSPPDIAFIGINQLRPLVDRGIVRAVDGLAGSDDDFKRMRFVNSTISLGQEGAKTYGLPFAISTPVLYVNEDLLAAAGGADRDLATWDGVVELSRKISALPHVPVGMSFQWDASGNWLFQALLNTHGGRLSSQGGCQLAFDDQTGEWALATLQKFHDAGMPDFSWAQARQAFGSGALGILAGSSSNVAQAARAAEGRFSFRTLPFPDLVQGGGVPAGGTIAVILTKDPAKQAAAWAYLKFATGPVGQTIMAKSTGYVPVNRTAIQSPALLGDYFKSRPNEAAAMQQMDLLRPWESWAGSNGVKIIAVIQDKVEAVVGGKTAARAALPALVHEVRPLLPATCLATPANPG